MACRRGTRRSARTVPWGTPGASCAGAAAPAVAHAAGRVGHLGRDAGLDVEPVQPLDLLDREAPVGVDDLAGEDEERAALLGREVVEKHGGRGGGRLAGACLGRGTGNPG